MDGFSSNVQDILENFEFRNQIAKLSKADALGVLIEKLTSSELDLSPAGIDNHGMGSVFEELVPAKPKGHAVLFLSAPLTSS